MSELHAGYEVTHDGRVFSVNSNWRGYGKRELSQTPNSDGYPSVRLLVNGKRKRLSVHGLVAKTHIGPQPMPGYEVRHIDGNKLNPHVDNLAWGTPIENAKDREIHGRTSKGQTHSTAISGGLNNPRFNKVTQQNEFPRQKISEAMRGKPWTQARRDANVK